ncbi:MAG: dephospho-CoA kinase [Coriobacteriales bacterium]|jgi:dephospho-CoA kinase|nr:dephospho-CoA kinase [Coriobacteriales bacterium]
MYTVFVTGGLASGKNTVCAMLKERGAAVLDLDAIAKEEQENPIILEALQEAFGDDIVDEQGSVDRKTLARYAFANAESVAELNAICHPPVRERLADILVGGGCTPRLSSELIVVQIPLLAEAPEFLDLTDEVIAVEADEELRLARAVERGMDKQDALNRLALQATDEQRREIATVIFDNNGTLGALEEQVNGWYTKRTSERLF